MLQSMGSERVGHDWATEQQQQSHLSSKQPVSNLVKVKDDCSWEDFVCLSVQFSGKLI